MSQNADLNTWPFAEREHILYRDQGQVMKRTVSLSRLTTVAKTRELLIATELRSYTNNYEITSFAFVLLNFFFFCAAVHRPL